MGDANDALPDFWIRHWAERSRFDALFLGRMLPCPALPLLVAHAADRSLHRLALRRVLTLSPVD